MQYLQAIVSGAINGGISFIPSKQRALLLKGSALISVSVLLGDSQLIQAISGWLQINGHRFPKYRYVAHHNELAINKTKTIMFYKNIPFLLVHDETNDRYGNGIQSLCIHAPLGCESKILEFIRNIRQLDAHSRLRGLQIKTAVLDRFQPEWAAVAKLETRHIRSICLDAEIKNALKQTIDRFMLCQTTHDQFGTTNKLVIMLHGPSGTGKTSLVKYIANYMQRSIYYIPPNVLTEKGVQAVISRADGNVLLTEEIELAFKDDSEEGKPTTISSRMNSAKTSNGLSTTINIMDGMLTPDKLIWVITSNDYASLDARLKRKCRVDLTLEIGYSNSDALLDFVRFVYGDEDIVLPAELLPYRFRGTDIHETYRENINDVAGFFRDIALLVV